MLFDNQNPFTNSNRPEDKLACYWYNQLWNKVISIFKWTGAPFDGVTPLMNSDYLEFILMTQGQAGILKDNEGNLRGLNITRVGFDPYMFPKSLYCANPVLGNFTGIVGIDAIWVRNNKFAQPTNATVKYFAQQLAKIQTSLNVSLSNNRMTKVFLADNDMQAQAIRKMVDDIDAGKLAVIQKPDIFDNIMQGQSKTPPVYSTPSEYLADKYLQDMRSILNDFFVTFGINASGANMIKKERNLTSEVDSNNQEIIVNRQYWLEPRHEAAKRASELFGTEIKVEIRQEEIEETEEEPDEQQLIDE